MIHNRKRQPQIHPEPKTREQLEQEFGQVWDTAELARDFIVTAIIANTVVVRRKADDCVGTLRVQERPRFYFGLRANELG